MFEIATRNFAEEYFNSEEWAQKRTHVNKTSSQLKKEYFGCNYTTRTSGRTLKKLKDAPDYSKMRANK